jgi:hypothetical protein
MVITQCDDHAPRRARIDALGVRIVNQFQTHEFRNMQLHPKDTGGSFFEIDEQLGARAHDPDGPWEPAGPDWLPHRVQDRVTGIAAAELQCDDPEAVARRWSEIAESRPHLGPASPSTTLACALSPAAMVVRKGSAASTFAHPTERPSCARRKPRDG